jgi:hypothetical protein
MLLNSIGLWECYMTHWHDCLFLGINHLTFSEELWNKSQPWSHFQARKAPSWWTPYRVMISHRAMIWRWTYLEIAQLQGSWGIPDNLWRFTQSSWGLLFTFCCYHLRQNSINITSQPVLHSQTVLTCSRMLNKLRGGTECSSLHISPSFTNSLCNKALNEKNIMNCKYLERNNHGFFLQTLPKILGGQ